MPWDPYTSAVSNLGRRKPAGLALRPSRARPVAHRIKSDGLATAAANAAASLFAVNDTHLSSVSVVHAPADRDAVARAADGSTA